MKKIVLSILLLLSFAYSEGQNRFPTTDSLQNYILRYVKNSSVESFTNYRLQNILIGLSQMVDTLRQNGYVDSIWIGTGDTLKYRIGNSTFVIGKIIGGSSYSFTYPLQLNTGVVSLDTTLWHSFPFYNTQYRPITWVPTLQEVTTQGRRTTDSIVFVANNENTQIGAIYQTSTGPDKRFLTYQTGSTFNSAYTQLTPSNLTWVTTGGNTLSITAPLSSPTDNRIIRFPDSSGVISVGAKINGTTVMAGSNGIINLGTVTTDISGKLNISDTSSMLSPYLRSNVAAATYQPIGSYLTTGTLTDSLPNAVSSIVLNTPNVVFTNPINFSKTGRAWSGTLALNNQSANRVFAGPTTGSAAAPTFRALVAADIPDLPQYRKNQDTIPLAVFNMGSGASGDVSAFTTSAIAGSFYLDGTDTFYITSYRVALQGTSPSITPDVWFNDSLNVTGAWVTKLVNSPSAITNTTTGTSVSVNNNKIPPGNFVFVRFSAVATAPTYFSLTLFGYRIRKQ